MKDSIIFENFNNGILLKQFSKSELNKINWNPHPKFKGVQLKNIITGSDTDNTISCHFVKIEPNCEISLHTHPDNLEIHEVIHGQGNCIMNTECREYNCGTVSIIPKNIEHKIVANDSGLYLFAKFIPALK